MRGNMKYIKKIWTFIKKIIYKESNIKMLETPSEKVESSDKDKFKSSLKITMKKKKVETLTCVGDGLGIQNGISY